MQQNPQRYYEAVHFHDYLDNGVRDLYLHDINALLEDPQSVTYTSSPSLKDIKPFGSTANTSIRDYSISSEESNRKNTWYMQNMVQVCSEMIGQDIIDVSFPGGIYRKSCRMYLNSGQSLIATLRNSPGRARLEERVLSKLRHEGGAVPEIYAFNGLLLLQEDLYGDRLDTALEFSDEEAFTTMANNALKSLAEIHQHAERHGLDQSVPMIGYDTDWLISFLDRTAVIGSFLQVPAPFIPADKLFDLLVLLKPRFVKWDARPGNATVNSDNNISWFDWEHCAVRNRIDDMAWFLCDEKIPDYPEAENKVIEQSLLNFSDGKSFDHAHDYLRLYGMLHMCVRLGRLLDLKGDHSWQELDQFLDRPENTSLVLAQRLCARASRWAENMTDVSHLKDWFLQISDRLGAI